MRGSKYLSLATISLLLALVAVSPLRAQRRRPGRARPKPARLEQTLLWEISGNGLPSPSYLYGTMHVTDRRAFDFSDSVLLKLHECATFASEVEIDSSMREVLRMYLADTSGYDMYDEGDDAIPYSLDDEDAGDSSATLTAPVDPVVADSIVVATPEPAGDSTAASDTRVRVSLPDRPTDSSGPVAVAPPSSRRRAWRRSLRGNPFANDFFKSASDPRPDDRPAILDAYLFRLARHEGKHLVGLESVDEQISALSNLSFADIWKSYLKQGPKKRRKLPLTTDPDKLQAMIIDYYERGDLEGIHDFFTDNWPPAYYDALLTRRNHHMADRAVPYMMKGSTFIAVGAGHLPGEEGLIDLFRKKGYTLRPVKAVRTGLAATYVEGSARPPWYQLAPSAGAYSVSMPAEPVDVSAFFIRYENSVKDGVGHIYIWPDLGSGITYSAGYIDYLRGYLLAYDPARFLDNVGDGTRELSHAERSLVHPIVVDDLPGREMELPGENNRVRRIRTVLRGTRLYRLTVETVPELIRSPDVERFLNSFAIAPVRHEPWREYRGTQFSVSVPGLPEVNTDQVGAHGDMLGLYGAIEWVKLRALDSNSGRFYQVDMEHYGEYFEVRDSAEFFDRKLYGLKLDGDSVLFEGEIVQDGFPAREVMGMHRGGLAYRARVVPKGDRLFKIWVELPASELRDSLTGLFFDSFHLGPDPASGDIFASKASRLLDDLASGDSARHGRAVRSAPYYNGFGVGDLPRIYALIDRSYPDDADEDGGTRAILLQQLGVLHDSATVPFLRRVAAADSGAPGIRRAVLSALADVATADATELFTEMILDSSVADDPVGASILRGVEGDSAFLRILFPRLLRLLDREAYRPSVYELAMSAIDSGALEPAALLPYGDTIVADLRATLGARDEGDLGLEDGWRISEHLRRAIDCSGHLASRPELIPLLERALDDGDPDIRMSAMIALVRKGRSVSPALLSLLASDPVRRVELYGRLLGAGRLDLFPKEHLSQKDIAEGELAAWIEEDDEYMADSLRLLAEREVTIDGVAGRVFLFAFHSGEDDRWMVGLSGPQPIERDRIALDGKKTWSDYEALEDMTIDEHFTSLLRDR